MPKRHSPPIGVGKPSKTARGGGRTFPVHVRQLLTPPSTRGRGGAFRGRPAPQHHLHPTLDSLDMPNLFIDPFDDLFSGFHAPKREQIVVEIEDSVIEEKEEDKDSILEMTETVTESIQVCNDISMTDLVLIDEESFASTMHMKAEEIEISDDEDEEQDIICLDDDVATCQATSSTANDVEKEQLFAIDKTGTELDRSGLYFVNEDHSSAGVPNRVLEMDEISRAAMEDSLVKGTCQKFRKIIRSWEVVRPLRHHPSIARTVIRVCSYNILCQDTIGRTRYLYRHLINSMNEGPLFWENRWPLLKQNLEHIGADIFGLQEVQDTHFLSYINPHMAQLGYGSMYTPKSFDYKDGCALFYRREKFDYIYSRKVEYFCGQGTSLDKPQIGQIIRLRCRVTKKEVVVANTHILFNMSRGDIKLGQLAILFANITAEMSEHGEAPLILLGDFNMDRLSHLYYFITKGTVFLKGLPRNALAWQREKAKVAVVDAEIILPPCANVGRDCKFQAKRSFFDKVLPSAVAKDTMSHSLNLWSAMAPIVGANKMNEVSTYHKDFGNPDFIFYSVKSKETVKNRQQTISETPYLRLHRRVTLPTLEQCAETLGPWPNSFVPSDHIPLIVEFQLRGDSS